METKKPLYTTEHETLDIGGLITTDASGDPTLTDNNGLSSVSKPATGTYKIDLKDKATRLLSAIPTIKLATGVTLMPRISDHDVTASSPYVTIECREVPIAKLLQLQAGTIFHGLVGTAVATADATSEATAVALTNALKAALNAHYASVATAGKEGAHHGTDAAIATADATDEASAITLANAIKADYNTHRASVAYHATADATNAVSSSNATDTASLYTLANEIKTDFNAHIASGLASLADVISGEIHLSATVRRR